MGAKHPNRITCYISFGKAGWLVGATACQKGRKFFVVARVGAITTHIYKAITGLNF